MISNLVLQDTINGIKNIGRCELTIVDLDGKVVASTEDENTIDRNDIVIFAQSQADSQEIRGSMYFKVYDDYQVEYVVIVTGGEDMSMIGKLAAFQIQNLVVAYKEHFDKDNFVKNLLLDNLLLVDVYNRAMKLHIATNVRRVVYILESEQSKDYSTLEAVKNLFSKSLLSSRNLRMRTGRRSFTRSPSPSSRRSRRVRKIMIPCMSPTGTP